METFCPSVECPGGHSAWEGGGGGGGGGDNLHSHTSIILLNNSIGNFWHMHIYSA